jgi:hypothetical protein
MASEDKIFLDTNVALDHLADRQPFAEYAHRLLSEISRTRFSISRPRPTAVWAPSLPAIRPILPPAKSRYGHPQTFSPGERSHRTDRAVISCRPIDGFLPRRRPDASRVSTMLWVAPFFGSTASPPRKRRPQRHEPQPVRTVKAALPRSLKQARAACHHCSTR